MNAHDKRPTPDAQPNDASDSTNDSSNVHFCYNGGVSPSNATLPRPSTRSPKEREPQDFITELSALAARPYSQPAEAQEPLADWAKREIEDGVAPGTYAPDDEQDDKEFYQWLGTYDEPHPTPKTMAKAAWFAAYQRGAKAMAETDLGRLRCFREGTGASAEGVIANPNLDQNAKALAREFLAIQQAMAEKAGQLQDALRSVNDLQHRMAIELDAIPQQPRIEFYTRQMEEIICRSLAGAVPSTPQCNGPHGDEEDCPVHGAEIRRARYGAVQPPQDADAALEKAATWCEQQTGDFAQYFTPENAAKTIRAMKGQAIGPQDKALRELVAKARLEEAQWWNDLRDRPKAEHMSQALGRTAELEHSLAAPGPMTPALSSLVDSLRELVEKMRKEGDKADYNHGKRVSVQKRLEGYAYRQCAEWLESLLPRESGGGK